MASAAADPTARDSMSLDVVHLPGLTPYLPMWERQQALAGARGRGEIGDLLILLEHRHVFTNGRRGRREHLLVAEERLPDLGVSYIEVDRGGDITYHGPGQLVGYPIIDLAVAHLGVRAYVRLLEQALLQTAAYFGVEAEIEPGSPGIWVGNAKLGAIGVKVSRGVAWHGFALNVDPDLRWFRHIVACGLEGRSVTSLAQVLGRPVAVSDVAPICARVFASLIGAEVRWRAGIGIGALV